MKTGVASLDATNGINDVLPFDDFTEYGVAPALRGGGGVIEKVVVRDIDKEL